MCVRVYVCVCVLACPRTCVRACVCVFACVRRFVCVYQCVSPPCTDQKRGPNCRFLLNLIPEHPFTMFSTSLCDDIRTKEASQNRIWDLKREGWIGYSVCVCVCVCVCVREFIYIYMGGKCCTSLLS